MKILLIDDNAGKGWEAVLRYTFEKLYPPIEFLAMKDSDVVYHKVVATIDDVRPDVIILDNSWDNGRNGERILRLYANHYYIIMLSGDLERGFAFASVGAKYFMPKEHPEYPIPNYKDHFLTFLRHICVALKLPTELVWQFI